MTQIWIYIVCWLVGCICGIMLWERIGTGDTFKGRVKIKNKRIKGSVDTNTSLEVEKFLDERKTKRKQRRIDRIKKKL